MSEQIAQLLVKIEAADMDENELEDLARLLQQDIESLDVESVEPVKGGDVPDGAMAAEWFEIGGLLIKMGTAVLPPLLLVIKTWLDHRAKARQTPSEENEIKIKIIQDDFSVEIQPSTTKQEIIIKTEALQKRIESN